MNNWIKLNDRWEFKRSGYEWGLRTKNRTAYAHNAADLFNIFLENEPDLTEIDAKELLKTTLCKMVDDWEVA